MGIVSGFPGLHSPGLIEAVVTERQMVDRVAEFPGLHSPGLIEAADYYLVPTRIGVISGAAQPRPH